MSTWTKRAVNAATAAILAAVLAVGLGCSRTEDPAPPGAAQPPPAPAEGEAPQRPAEATPEPWEYDAARDRHWHPGHGHWHAGPPPAHAEAPAADAQEEAEAAELRWLTSLPEALEAARKAQNLVLVDAYAEWCGWCKKLEAETLAHPDVQERLKGFTLLKIDTDKQGELAQRLGVTGLPTILILNAEGDVVVRQAGFVPPEAFLEFLAQHG